MFHLFFRKRAAVYLSFFFIICSFAFANDNTSPEVSIITSIWNGDEFIEGFLADITKQTVFSKCELILINASSPGNEEPIIKNYMTLYPNIIYERLPQDPGLYAVWNLSLKKAWQSLAAPERCLYTARQHHY